MISNNKSLLEGKNLFFTYPKTNFKISVPNISLEKGKCFALCGKNGSGKTTLGQLIIGILTPDSGEIFLNDENITSWTLGKKGISIGYLFQEPSKQIFASTVLEEMIFSQRYKGIKEDKAKLIAIDILKKLELDKFLEQSTFTLSRGEKQRLAIATILLSSPKFIILDEPTTGLDNRRKNILASILGDLKDSGIGLLLISHDFDFVNKISDKILYMEGGSLIE